MSTKILVMKSEVIMQFNLIDYKELTQTAWGRSQYNNDKMRVVFAEGIKCRKDCSLMCLRTQTVRQFERITYTCMLRRVARNSQWGRGLFRGLGAKPPVAGGQ